MSLFGNIMSIQDAINRLPQFEHQINKLSSEEKSSKTQKNLRSSFIRRCQELHKQLDDHNKRIENIKTEDQYKKNLALEQTIKLKNRLSELSPEKDRTSSTMASERRSVDSEELTEQKELLVDQKRRDMMQRRQSTMYDGDEDSDSDEKTKKIEETKEEIVVISSQPVPQPRTNPMVRHPIKITQSAHPQPQVSVPKASETARTDNSGTTIFDPDRIVDGNTFIVLKDLEAEGPGDLHIREGDILQIVKTRPDGWWLARNEGNQEGLVPKTYLKHMPNPNERSKVAKRLGTRDSVIAGPRIDQMQRKVDTEDRAQGIASTAGAADVFSAAVTMWTGKRVECLGDALRCDHHLSYSCHLAPRLSHSNIGFHDLFWNTQGDQVRKRNIRISRMLRLVRLEGMPTSSFSKALVRIALLDENKKRGRQIVSNVHTIQPRVKGSTWHFINKEEQTRSCIEFADVIIRSNYSLSDVILVVEASVIVANQQGFEEKSLGVKRISLLERNGQPKIVSRTYVEQMKDENLFTGSGGTDSTRRIFFKIMDLQKEKVHFVDSMPDVLIFNAMYLPFFFFYRRRAGTILIRDNPNPLSSEMVSDPLLSVFPDTCDQHDIMDAMLSLWNAKKKIVSKKSEVDQTIEFFQTFLHTAFFIHGTQIMPAYEIGDDVALAGRQKVIRTIVETLKKGQLRSLLAVQKCKPINIFDYSLDLLGSHSID